MVLEAFRRTHRTAFWALSTDTALLTPQEAEGCRCCSTGDSVNTSVLGSALELHENNNKKAKKKLKWARAIPLLPSDPGYNPVL